MRLGGGQGVLQQAGDGHRPDAARHRGYGGRDCRLRFGEIHVAHKPRLARRRLFRVFRGHAVDADVDHHGAGFDPVRLDHFGAADGGDQDVRLAADGGEVLWCGSGRW